LDRPAIGSQWLHKNGCTYRVLCVVNDKKGLPPDEYLLQVVYYDVDDPINLFAKSPEAFMRSRRPVED
jgi:hypothetical protein